MATFEEVADARRLLADVLDGLEVEQWGQPSSCGRWTVQEVVGHLLVGPIKGMRGQMGPLLRARMDFAAATAEQAERMAEMGPDGLRAALRDNTESTFAPPGLGPTAPLTDTVMHTLDICRPLGIEPEIPVEWSIVALEAALSRRFGAVNPGGRGRAVSYRASDADRSWGAGPEVVGRVEDLAHGAWGRIVDPTRLTGPGAPMLTGVDRISA